MKPERLVGCAIVRAESLLLVHRVEGRVKQWELPGGRINWEEPYTEAAVRKVRDQLGVNAMIGTCLGAWEFEQRGNLYHSTVFNGRIGKDAEPRLQRSVHDAYEYFHRRTLRRNEDDLSPNVQLLLKKFIDGEIQLAIT